MDYRLAPEHPYPAAVEDVYTGFVWLAGEADALNLDPQRIVVGGVSAGGGIDPVPAYAAPARAADLTGLPPTFIDVGSAETFRDEDVDYARRMWAAGGDAELHVWPGGAHGFDALVPEAQLSLASLHARTDWLRRLLARLG